jgi:hypothetical protein
MLGTNRIDAGNRFFKEGFPQISVMVRAMFGIAIT